jgi:hypothetical protein
MKKIVSFSKGLTTSLFFLVFITFQSELSAQDFGIGISPEISYRNLVKTDFAPGIDDFIESSNASDEAIFGFRVQALFLKNFGRRMQFETGISAARHGFNTVISDLEMIEGIGTGNGSMDPGFASTQEIEFNFRYYTAGIPLRLVYTSEGETVRFTWGLGITPELIFHTSQTKTYTFESGIEETFEADAQPDPATFNLMGSLSAGVEISLDRRTFMRLEPVVRYGLLPLIDEAAYEMNLFSYGLSAKLFFTPRNRW